MEIVNTSKKDDRKRLLEKELVSFSSHDGDEIYWLIVTGISEDGGWSKDAVKTRKNEIDTVAKKYKFTDVFNLQLPTTKIDTLPLSDLLVQINNIADRY